MILYEYPLNERIRTFLRLEHLFTRLRHLITEESAVSHHFSLATIFEIMDVCGRADLKTEVMKDIERQRQLLKGFRGNPAISEVILDQVIRQLREQKKPAMMPYRDFKHCHHQLLLYVMQDNLLHRMLNIWTPQELVEQLFLAQPKAHQAKYVKISEDVEQDADKLCTFFEGCHVEYIADACFKS